MAFADADQRATQGFRIVTASLAAVDHYFSDDLYRLTGDGCCAWVYGNENWEFDEQGLMRRRIASINDLPIKETERKYRWPLGRRPDDHPSLSELGL